MSDKLIDGNITIKDAASKGLSLIEKKLLSIRKSGAETVKEMERLKEEWRSIKEEQHKLYRRRPVWEKKPAVEFPMKNYDYGRVKIPSYPNLASFRYRGDFTSGYYGHPDWNWAKYKVRPNRISLSERSFVQSPTNWAETNSRIAVADRLPMTRGKLSLNSRSLGISALGLSSRRTSISPIETHPDGMINTKANFSTVGLDSRKLALSFPDNVMRLNKGNFGRVPIETHPDGMINTKSNFSAYSLDARRLGVSALDMAGRKSSSQKSILEATKTVTESAKKAEKAVSKTTETVKKGLTKKVISGWFSKAKDGLSGALEGRLSSAMFSGSGIAGSILGGFAKGGPIGAVVGVATELITNELTKILDSVQEVIDAVNRISEERARESIGLRRKMQMSYEMFGVNPTDIKQIDKKIYAMREKEQQMYLHNLPGRDVTQSSIEWLHLLGTKDSGGVFENEKEAFKFSKSLAAIAKMNDLSPQEYETVRYQGMQILSKGYADILDIKPLLNSAPGFVRDILNQTGMTRKDLLESGRSRGFTADMFKQALLNVGDYYETLASRATSRTPEDQEEYAEQIVGRASIYDELYRKEKAMQNTKIMTAVAEANMLESMKESWYQMWSDTNDAYDGVEAKVKFEKKVMGFIMRGLVFTIFGARVLKNILDGAFDIIKAIAKEVWQVMNFIPTVLRNGIAELLSFLFDKLSMLDPLDKFGFKNLSEALDPDAKFKLNERYVKSRAEDINARISKIDPKTDEKGLREELLRMGIGYRKFEGYKNFETGEIISPDKWGELAQGIASGKLDASNYREVYKLELPENFVDELFYGGGGADKKTGRIADESYRQKVLEKNVDLYADMEDGLYKDREAFRDLEGRTRSLSKVLGDAGKSASMFKWGTEMLNGFINPFKEIVSGARETDKDLLDAGQNMNKALEQIRAAEEDVHSATMDIAGNVKNISKGKGNEKILDILKEIAGVTVINKVTQVRPDVVFNYGSYGRNSGNEDRNLIRVGDPNFLASAVQALNAVAAKWDDNFQSIANGVPSEVSIA